MSSARNCQHPRTRAALFALTAAFAAAGCSVFNREGPDVDCADLVDDDGLRTSACEDGIIASCPDGKRVKYKICDSPSACEKSWQTAGLYRCEEYPKTDDIECVEGYASSWRACGSYGVCYDASTHVCCASLGENVTCELPSRCYLAPGASAGNVFCVPPYPICDTNRVRDEQACAECLGASCCSSLKLCDATTDCGDCITNPGTVGCSTNVEYAAFSQCFTDYCSGVCN
ncbi:MAG: hypothetical protein HY744_02450 [Deltaproteobacteria bacterium]|nr:hypothetical protein [Deltaproteobacteria bacterium]